jgi:hypothetical protein
MIASGIGYWVLFILLSAGVYCLPGLAIQRLIHLKGIGRGGQVLLSVPISLVAVPICLVIVSHASSFIPFYWMVLAISGLLACAGWCLRRVHRRPELTIRGRNGNASSPSLREWILVSGFILFFALLVNLPRLEMFVHGDQSSVAASWDEYWHLSELTSVARTGIPPQHYLFPDISLVYYYFSWILPATLANQSLLSVSLARALAWHGFLQALAFIGLAYFFLRQNTKTRLGRISGLSFFTFVGGLDYFVTLRQVEWWQTDVEWLVSRNQISSFVTLYLWVPQHVAGGMAFLLGLVLWRNIRGSIPIRIALLGVLFAFMFGTSVYVFIASCLALAVWGWTLRRKLFRARHLRWALLFAAVLIFIGWHQALLTLSHSASISQSPFRIPLLERYLGTDSNTVGLVDHYLTIAAFPLIAPVILSMEMGIVFLLYLVWLFSKGIRSKTGWGRFAALFPLLFYFCSCLVTDHGGGDNFTMRGMIPAEIVIAFAAAFYMDSIQIPKGLWVRIGLAYVALVVIVTHAISWMNDLQSYSREPLGNVLGLKGKQKIYGFIVASSVNWPDDLMYIHWLNQNSEPDALIVEDGVPAKDNLRYHLLERERIIDPSQASGMEYFYHDTDLMSLGQWEAYRDSAGNTSLLDRAKTSAYCRTRSCVLYYVVRNPAITTTGTPVYQDDFVRVYRILAGENK